MDEPVVSIEEIQRRAREAFERGDAVGSCLFPRSSAAYQTWMAEYLRLQNEARATS